MYAYLNMLYVLLVGLSKTHYLYNELFMLVCS